MSKKGMEAFAPVIDTINQRLLVAVQKTADKLNIDKAPADQVELELVVQHFLANMTKESKDALKTMRPKERNILEKGIYGLGYGIGYPVAVTKALISMLPGAEAFKDGYLDSHEKASTHIAYLQQQALILKLKMEAKMKGNKEEEVETTPEVVPTPA